MKPRFFAISALAALLICSGPYVADAPAGSPKLYKTTPGPLNIQTVDTLTLHDAARDKNLDLRLTFPEKAGRYPLIIFSHGATGSKEAYDPLRTHFASHGYVVIQPTHGDSLKKVGLRGLINKREIFKHWNTRPPDIHFILDHLDEIEKRTPALRGKIDRENIAMAGHSFGAHTSMALAGLKFKIPIVGREVQFTDPRPKCFLLISPQGPGGLITEQSYKPIDRPAMVITGTHDTSIDKQPAAWRLKVYELMPAGDKYLLNIDGAHHGFGGIAGDIRYPSSGPMNEDHVNQVKSASMSFFDAYLKDTPAAKRHLKSDNIKSK